MCSQLHSYGTPYRKHNTNKSNASIHWKTIYQSFIGPTNARQLSFNKLNVILLSQSKEILKSFSFQVYNCVSKVSGLAVMNDNSRHLIDALLVKICSICLQVIDKQFVGCTKKIDIYFIYFKASE